MRNRAFATELIAKAGVALIAAVAALTALAPPVHAQNWPAKPIRMVIPYPPGGPTDVLGRIAAIKLSEALGQQVVVDNKPGASGQIGAADVAKSPPDGYTLLTNASIHVINPHVYTKPLVDPIKDFAGVGLVGTVALVLVVPPSLPVRNVAELIAYAKSNPGRVNFASSSLASAPHLAGEFFKQSTGLDLQHIPYKGSAPALADLAGGQVQLMFDSMPSAMPFVRSGRLKALAVSAPRRVGALPDVPTMIESGVAGFDLGSWYGVYAPAGTPRAILQRLNSMLASITVTADVRERLAAIGAEPAPLDLEEFAAFNRSEYERWGRIVKAAGVKLD